MLMSLPETIDQASQQLRSASPSQAADILRLLIGEFSDGSYLVSSGKIVDETGAATRDFEAIIHEKFEVDPKHPASIPADASAATFCIFDNMTIADLRAACDRP